MLLLADSPKARDIGGSRGAKVEDFSAPVRQPKAEGRREQSCRVKRTRQIYSRKPKNIVEGSGIKDLLGA